MKQKRILLIDDEDDLREVAQVSLEIVAGWDVKTACCGSEGIIQAQKIQPDAILLDVMMPDMDGVTTFRHLQADPTTRKIPVIFLTAKVQSSDQRQFAELGVSGVISKPFDPISLATQVAAALDWES